MKKKTNTWILAGVVLLLGFALTFTGCSNPTSGPNSHTHAWGEWTHSADATCLEPAKETRICTVDASHTETRDKEGSSSLDHDMVWVVTTPASITEEGIETDTCQRPGCNHTAGTRPIPTIAYTIIPSGGGFSASFNGAAKGNAGDPIQDLINAIRAYADGEDITIQFGSGGDNVLNIGSSQVVFGGVWGKITLRGSITSSNNVSNTGGTIVLEDNVSITSTGNVTNTGGNTFDGSAIRINTTGSVSITGGTVTTSVGRTIVIDNSAHVTVSGNAIIRKTTPANFEATISLRHADARLTVNEGTVLNAATTGVSRGIIYNASNENGGSKRNDAIVINGGLIEATGDIPAIFNAGEGGVTISGTNTIIRSADIYSSLGVIALTGSSTLTINGGTVENTANNGNAVAIHNSSANGSIAINGGTVRSNGGDNSLYAIRVTAANTGGSLTITGSPEVTAGLDGSRTNKDAIQFNGTGTYTTPWD